MALFNQTWINIASQFGMPLFGVSGTPPFTGNAFWVDETNGSDGNTGGPQDPLTTLAQAHSLCVANNNDVVFFTGSIHTTATLNWSKNWTHLIGLSAPSVNGRARISSTGTTPFSPLVNVTAQGCIFKNFGTFHGGFTSPTGSQVCWAEAGGRNGYSNAQLLGGGDATAAALTGMRSVTIGSSENLFEDCTFGLDTIVRATNANATMEIISGAARNVVRRGNFQAYCTDASDTHVLIAANGMDRYLILDDCVFHNFGGTLLNAVVSNAGGSPGGDVIITPSCISVGATALATAGSVYVGQISAAGATTTNKGILAT